MKTKTDKPEPVLYVAVWTVDSEPTVIIATTESRLYAKLWKEIKPWWDGVLDSETPNDRKYAVHCNAYFAACSARENGEYCEFITYTEKDIT